ncbi:MAG: M56 family metallopeptidase [Phycisphaerales bacterium]|nr:MAG: M56 family metallopeptidase [Phycisphaerales bacterium]
MTHLPTFSAFAEFALDGLLLLCVGAVWALFARRSSAATRHAIWTVTLTSALVLGVLAVSLPSVELSILPADWFDSKSAGQSASVALTASSTFVQPPRLRHAAPLGSALVALWLFGATLFGLRLLADTWRIGRIARRTQPLTGPGWADLLDALPDRAGSISADRLRLSRLVPVPVAWGLRRPIILFPACAQGWPGQRRIAALLHEIAHLDRHDCVWDLLAFLGLSLHWFNPLAWYAYHCQAAESERAADDWVVERGMPGPDYASHLLSIARNLKARGLAAWPASAMAGRANLTKRLKSLLDDRIPRRPLSRQHVAAAVLAAIVPAGALACVQFATNSPPPAGAERVPPALQENAGYLGLVIQRLGEARHQPLHDSGARDPRPALQLDGGELAAHDQRLPSLPTAMRSLGNIWPWFWVRDRVQGASSESAGQRIVPRFASDESRLGPLAQSRLGRIPRLNPDRWRHLLVWRTGERPE